MAPANGLPDAATIHRMRAAHACAADVFNATPEPTRPEAWGWQGRTLGRPVTTANGPAWLRLMASRTDQIVDTYWTGNVDAQLQLPSSIPRPQLRAWHDWTDHGWAYRAELHDSARGQPLADTAVLASTPHPPTAWWTDLRAALDIIAAVPTQRISVRPEFLTWAMPHYLGLPIKPPPIDEWTTAHGGPHYANLCSPDLTILDWEGWGRAPAGYDAATLHGRSLTSPVAAARIRTELAAILETPAGRLAELAVIAELLHAADRGAHPQIVNHLRHRAKTLRDTT